MIKRVYEKVKEHNAVFGISPAADIEKTERCFLPMRKSGAGADIATIFVRRYISVLNIRRRALIFKPL